MKRDTMTTTFDGKFKVGDDVIIKNGLDNLNINSPICTVSNILDGHIILITERLGKSFIVKYRSNKWMIAIKNASIEVDKVSDRFYTGNDAIRLFNMKNSK